MAPLKDPPRYRAVGSNVIDSKLGSGETVIIHANNNEHCRAIVKALNAYDVAVRALRSISDHDTCSPACRRIAAAALQIVDSVVLP